MYVEGGHSAYFSKAVLQSPPLGTSSRTCEMYFWYNMYGSSVGSLIVTAYINNTERVLKRITGSQSQSWQKATIYLGRMLGPQAQGFRVRFEVLPGRGFLPSSTDDIAIDDISFNNCNPIVAVPNVNCNFNFDICKWTQALDDVFDWTLKDGSTTSVGTGPPSDHTGT